MQPFSIHTGMVMPLDKVNVDTDQMVPKQFLKALTREGFGRILFYDWRYLPGEKPNPEFVLNFPRYKGASVLLARANFGCGSSREHAPWGVKDYGFRVVIAPSYADIFYNNCFKNGILPATLTEAELRQPGEPMPQDIDSLCAQRRRSVARPSTDFPLDIPLRPAAQARSIPGRAITATIAGKTVTGRAEHVVALAAALHDFLGHRIWKRFRRLAIHFPGVQQFLRPKRQFTTRNCPWNRQARGLTVAKKIRRIVRVVARLNVHIETASRAYEKYAESRQHPRARI